MLSRTPPSMLDGEEKPYKYRLESIGQAMSWIKEELVSHTHRCCMHAWVLLHLYLTSLATFFLPWVALLSYFVKWKNRRR